MKQIALRYSTRTLLIIGTFLMFWNFETTGQVQVGGVLRAETNNTNCGYKVDISDDGNRVAVACPGLSNAGFKGIIRMYEWRDTGWAQMGSDILGENNGDQAGESISLSGNGSRIVIGSYENSDGGQRAGHARIFEWNGTDWEQLGQDIDGDDPGDWSGQNVAISGDGSRVAIGSQLNDDAGSNTGHIRMFEWNGSMWIQLGTAISGLSNADQFGSHVSLSYNGGRVAAGSWSHDGNGTNSGHIRVFGWTGSAWQIVGTSVDGDNAGDQLNLCELSDDGQRLAIICAASDAYARLLEFNGVDWVPISSDINSLDPLNDDGMYRMDISSDGTFIAVGYNLFDIPDTPNIGMVRVYELFGSDYVQIDSQIVGTLENSRSGYDIGISEDGERVIIGAPFINIPGGFGEARVYQFCNEDLNINGLVVDSDTTLLARGTIMLDSVTVNPNAKLDIKSNEVIMTQEVQVILGGEMETIHINGCHEN